MLGTIAFILSICIIFSVILYLFDPERLKMYRLKKTIEYEYNTKVKFSCETKIMGTYCYIFIDDNTAYTISEYGNICGKKRR